MADYTYRTTPAEDAAIGAVVADRNRRFPTSEPETVAAFVARSVRQLFNGWSREHVDLVGSINIVLMGRTSAEDRAQIDSILARYADPAGDESAPVR